MEHVYFPLGLWLAGLLMSAIFLLAEIIINRRRKSQIEVGAIVTQSTPESGNLGDMVSNKWKADTEAAEVVREY